MSILGYGDTMAKYREIIFEVVLDTDGNVELMKDGKTYKIRCVERNNSIIILGSNSNTPREAYLVDEASVDKIINAASLYECNLPVVGEGFYVKGHVGVLSINGILYDYGCRDKWEKMCMEYGRSYYHAMQTGVMKNPPAAVSMFSYADTYYVLAPSLGYGTYFVSEWVGLINQHPERLACIASGVVDAIEDGTVRIKHLSQKMVEEMMEEDGYRAI